MTDAYPVPLMEWQRRLIEKLIEAWENGEKVMVLMPRQYGHPVLEEEEG